MHDAKWNTRRIGSVALAMVLAACGLACLAVACIGALGLVASVGVSDADSDRDRLCMLLLMAWPAYVFSKWTRAISRYSR